MSHNEKRSHWVKEGVISLTTGIVYGVTVVAVSHPFDNIKTMMQAKKGFEEYNLFRTATQIAKVDGIKGFYRGCIPPLWGSGMYRSIQFSAFEAVYTYLDNSFGKTTIPLTFGIQLRVICGGIFAGSCRSLIETPLEYAKTKRQLGETWKLKDTFTGFRITWLRACVLMPTYFVFLDSFRRHFDSFFRNNLMGPFLASGCSSVFAWWVCWPLELLKCQVQSGYLNEKHMTIPQRIKFIIKERGGVFGLYRGIAAGSMRSFIGNGTAMIAMQWLQKKVTELGLRD